MDKCIDIIQRIILILALILNCEASSSSDCKGAIFRQRGHFLVSGVQAVLNTSGIDECIFQCINSHRRFNFYCLSGLFYDQIDNFNCLLNSETRRIRPDLYVQNDKNDAEYFEVECASQIITKRQADGSTRNRNVLQLNKPEFGNWTMCDREKLQHSRFRQCQTLNPNKCQVASNDCDPAKESEYDLQGGQGGSSGGGITGNSPPPLIPPGVLPPAPSFTESPSGPEGGVTGMHHRGTGRPRPSPPGQLPSGPSGQLSLTTRRHRPTGGAPGDGATRRPHRGGTGRPHAETADTGSDNAAVAERTIVSNNENVMKTSSGKDKGGAQRQADVSQNRNSADGQWVWNGQAWVWFSVPGEKRRMRNETNV